MKYEIEIPDGIIPKGKRPVEYRWPTTGELHLTVTGARLILVDEPPDWEWPEWLDCDALQCESGIWFGLTKHDREYVPFAILNHPTPPDRDKVYRREDYIRKDGA